VRSSGGRAAEASSQRRVGAESRRAHGARALVQATAAPLGTLGDHWPRDSACACARPARPRVGSRPRRAQPSGSRGAAMEVKLDHLEPRMTLGDWWADQRRFCTDLWLW
jgi:hypothetical protein